MLLIGHDELTNAFNQISNGIKNKDLEESDLSVEIIDNCLYTYPSPPPDLLIRTSGETRLSDFMLWQVNICSRIAHYARHRFTCSVRCSVLTVTFISRRSCGRNSPRGISWPRCSCTRETSDRSYDTNCRPSS